MFYIKRDLLELYGSLNHRLSPHYGRLKNPALPTQPLLPPRSPNAPFPLIPRRYTLITHIRHRYLDKLICTKFSFRN